MRHELLPRRLGLGVHHLGVVTLRGPPLVVGGQLVDQVGHPAADVSLRVSHQCEDERWVQLRRMPVRTDAQGRFEVRGDAEPRPHVLTAEGPGFLPLRDVPFALGADHLRLVLTRAGALTGRVLLDDGIEPWMVTACLSDPADPATKPEQLDARARFVLAPLAPGRVRLTIAAHTVGVLHEVELEVPPGAPVDLGDIDLRDALHRIAFVVVDEEVRRLAHAFAMVLAAGRDGIGRERWEGVPIEAGAACVLSRTPAVALLIRAKGPRCAWFHGVADGARLVMPPPAEVQITVPPAAVEALEEGEWLAAGLVSRDRAEDGVLIRSSAGIQWSGTGSPWMERSTTRFVGGVARLRVPGPGTFEVSVCLEGQGQLPLLKLDEMPHVTVAFPFVPQTVHVPLAPARLAEWRAGVGK